VEVLECARDVGDGGEGVPGREIGGGLDLDDAAGRANEVEGNVAAANDRDRTESDSTGDKNGAVLVVDGDRESVKVDDFAGDGIVDQGDGSGGVFDVGTGRGV